MNPVSNVIKISQKINKFDIDDNSFEGWTDELDNVLLKSIIEFGGDFDLISESFEMIDKCRNNTNSEKNESTSSSSDINVDNKNEKKNAPNDLSTLQKIASKLSTEIISKTVYPSPLDCLIRLIYLPIVRANNKVLTSAKLLKPVPTNQSTQQKIFLSAQIAKKGGEALGCVAAGKIIYAILLNLKEVCAQRIVNTEFYLFFCFFLIYLFFFLRLFFFLFTSFTS